MTEADNDSTSDGYSIDDLDDEQLDDLAEELKSRIDSRDKEEISAKLGMFRMEVSTHESLDDAVEAFEGIWENRVEEIEESYHNTLKEKLNDDDRGGIILG